jgi:flagellar motor switch protein FliM
MADELLSQAELETLLSKETAGAAPCGPRLDRPAQPVPHGASPQLGPAANRPGLPNVEPQQLAMLRARHESFGRKLSAALSAWLRLVVEVRLHAVEQRTLGEILDAMETPTFCQLLHAAPREAPGIVHLPLDVLYVILDRLLGGGREPAVVVRRPPTEIELRLAARITGRVVNELKTAWQGMLDMEPSADRVESDNRWASAPLRAAPMLAFSYEIKLSDTHGVMLLAIPLATLHRGGRGPAVVRGDADVLPMHAAAVGETACAALCPLPAEQFPQGLAAHRLVELVACLSETRITASDLQQLRPGDIIATEQPADGLLAVLQDGTLRYQARIGSYQGQKAIEIEQVVAAPDPGTAEP